MVTHLFLFDNNLMDAKTRHQTTDNRTAARYPVALYVELEHGSGWTRDVSTVGACIETDRSYGCGDAIRFYLHQPDPQGGMIRMECNGVVVRTEQEGVVWRLGVKMEAVRFESVMTEGSSAVSPSFSADRFNTKTSANRINRFNFSIGKRGEMS
jgi:hypothetical protein